MDESNPFITYLEGLSQDRGALAALRRGLGQPPGTAPDMYPYVVPWLGDDVPRWRENAHYLIASLYAYHPEPGGSGNLGDQFARARGSQGDDIAIERRFSALLSAHPDDLPFYLRQAVSYLRSKEVPINWHTLLRDVMAWGHPDRYVQRNWARAFWGRASRQTTPTEED